MSHTPVADALGARLAELQARHEQSEREVAELIAQGRAALARLERAHRAIDRLLADD